MSNQRGQLSLSLSLSFPEKEVINQDSVCVFMRMTISSSILLLLSPVWFLDFAMTRTKIKYIVLYHHHFFPSSRLLYQTTTTRYQQTIKTDNINYYQQKKTQNYKIKSLGMYLCYWQRQHFHSFLLLFTLLLFLFLLH